MRRVCVIPYPSKFVSSDSPKLKNPDKFPNHFPKDPTIKEKLPTWAPYFLAMLWQRYLKLKHSYFMDLSETRRPEAVNEATTNYKKESSVYASFYEDKMEEKLGYRQNLNEVFNRFKDHLRDSESMKKVDRKAFETQMKRFLNIRIENKIKWVYDCVIMGQGEEYNS
jgi:phage/plasmid-associated DNA primase